MSTSFAIAGYGHIGKIHARTITSLPDARCAAIIDIDAEKREQAGADWDNVYESLEAFIKADQGKTDIISVCVPNGLHSSLAIQALENGYHVIIEKPMALTRKDCENIIATADKQGKMVFVAKQNRFSPPTQWLKLLIDKKLLGEIYLVQICCFWNRDKRYYESADWRGSLALDGGPLFTQFSHFIDIMYWIFGDITNIYSRFYNFNHGLLTQFEDSGCVQFDFINGGAGTINYSTSAWDTNMESSVTVLGSMGSVKVGGQYMNEVEYCHIMNYVVPEIQSVLPPNDYGVFKGSAANHFMFFQNVINTLKDEEELLTNPGEAMMVVDIIERIYLQRDYPVSGKGTMTGSL